MRFKIELRYFYGWDDANWTEEKNGQTRPLRFWNIEQAQAALAEFFRNVKEAVVAGNMNNEETPHDYRIVAVND
jgi:hypothetical protein